ncbi:hypothetical protein N7454_001649 [Penicillium verhagenii]|nr:hypothetical protein N7454_001649 [Penicillium verhagenii]
MEQANELPDIEDWESFVPPRVDQGDDLPSIEEVLRMFEHFNTPERAPRLAVEYRFNEWVKSIYDILVTMGLEGLVSDKPRPKKYDKKGEKWMRLSRLVSLWIQETIVDRDLFIEMTTPESKDLEFADKFMSSAKEWYNSERRDY